MYPYILCFCGRELASLYTVFKIMRNLEYQKAYANTEWQNVDPAILSITEALSIDLSHVFDELKLHMVCCRIHMATQVEFKSVY